MRKFIISAALLAATATAVPAAAHNEYRRGHSSAQREITVKLQQLHRDIDRAAARRQLGRGEAVQLQRQHDYLQHVFRNYRRNGLQGWEASELRQRIAGLRERLRYARNDRNWNDRNWNDRDWNDRHYSRRNW